MWMIHQIVSSKDKNLNILPHQRLTADLLVQCQRSAIIHVIAHYADLYLLLLLRLKRKRYLLLHRIILCQLHPYLWKPLNITHHFQVSLKIVICSFLPHLRLFPVTLIIRMSLPPSSHLNKFMKSYIRLQNILKHMGKSPLSY